ncbi:exopolysaccharide Pel transporter PelG [Muricoccus radiodurans]|uniref:exopolysaccharide Pel transporter PelG n=1 Tax=Muricoccus radiodurans TaxID=2231721 RepID=UPI003CF2C534
MAGIGFVLRRLARRDDLSGGAQAYAAAVAVTSGPWLLTVAAILAVEWWSRVGLDAAEIGADFRTILSYNFCFSLVLTSPFAMVASRIAADRIFAERVESLGGLFLHALTGALILQLPPAVVFWWLIAELPPALSAAAVANYASLVGLWTVVTFLSVLKDHRLALGAVALGMGVAAVGAVAGKMLGAAAPLSAFTLGATVIVFVGGGRLLLEFPWVPTAWRATWNEARRFPDLAFIGLVSAAAPWADKWVMWLSPWAEVLPSGLHDFPDYDGAMFLAYLTMVPGIALFFVSVETEFFLLYRLYFDDLLGGASLSRIERSRRALVDGVVSSGVSLLLLQSLVAAVVILMGPALEALGVVSAAQYPIFRLGVLGALFHTLVLGLMIVLAYLDVRRSQLLVAGGFLLLNAAVPAVLLPMGEWLYGYGYFLASLGTALGAVAAVFVTLRRLNHHVFVRNNPSLRPTRAARMVAGDAP